MARTTNASKYGLKTVIKPLFRGDLKLKFLDNVPGRGAVSRENNEFLQSGG